MTKEEQLVIRKAVQWWNNRRPIRWTRAEHLIVPRVNTAGSSSEQLADAVARHLKSKLREWKRK